MTTVLSLLRSTGEEIIDHIQLLLDCLFSKWQFGVAQYSWCSRWEIASHICDHEFTFWSFVCFVPEKKAKKTWFLSSVYLRPVALSSYSSFINQQITSSLEECLRKLSFGSRKLCFSVNLFLLQPLHPLSSLMLRKIILSIFLSCSYHLWRSMWKTFWILCTESISTTLYNITLLFKIVLTDYMIY